VEIEVAGGVGFGVDEQASAADAGSEFRDSENDVCEQRCAEASVFVGEVDAETRKEGDRLAVLLALARRAWRCSQAVCSSELQVKLSRTSPVSRSRGRR